MFTQFDEEFLRKFADVGIASAVSVGAGAIHVRRAGNWGKHNGWRVVVA